jgi:hypothetical protein
LKTWLLVIYQLGSITVPDNYFPSLFFKQHSCQGLGDGEGQGIPDVGIWRWGWGGWMGMMVMVVGLVGVGLCGAMVGGQGSFDGGWCWDGGGGVVGGFEEALGIMAGCEEK